MASIKKNSGVTAITKRDIGHPQGLSFGFPPPVKWSEYMWNLRNFGSDLGQVLDL